MDSGEGNVICRLCLKKLNENWEPIEEIVQHTLNFLTLYLNLTISDDPMICETCAMGLKKCFDFKARCLSTEDCLAPFTKREDKKFDLRDIHSKVKLGGNVDRVPDNHNVCRFCLEIAKDNVSTSLRHDVDLIEILQKYFLEMDLRITDDIIACTQCYNSLQFHVSLVNNYMGIEKKIHEYCKVEGVNYKGQVDLRDVATFVSKSMLNVENVSSLIIKGDKPESIVNTSVDVKVKYEEQEEKLVDEEAQQKNNNSLQHHSPPSQLDCAPQLTRTKPTNMCEICGYQNNRRGRLEKHMLKHKTAPEGTVLQCAICSYQSNCRQQLQAHIITHKNDTELTTYKCDLCDYRSTWKSHVKRHMLTHKTPSEVTMYKCETCDFETKWITDINRHMITHKTPSEITKHKCDLCAYETKRKSELNRHMISHKPPSEITIYRCEACAYETKHKDCLQKHRLRHKDVSEVKMHKCEVCPYESKWSSNFRRHLLSHKKTPNVT